MPERITISPTTRLEGHAKIEIFLDEKGNVKDAYFQTVEFRGFEQFCVGRPVEEMPRITPRICGVCPTAHHLASAKATDDVFKAELPSTAIKIRRLLNHAQFIHDHTLHVFILAGPDLIMGPKAPVKDRNILGIIRKVGIETGRQVIKARAYGQRIIEIIGGKPTHTVAAVPGGVSKPLTRENIEEIRGMVDFIYDFTKAALSIFKDLILKNEENLDLIKGDIYRQELNYMGIVNEKNQMDLYDGKIRIVDVKGKEIAKFPPREYLNHIAEVVLPWTYIKFPHLKKIGWNGFREGEGTQIYCVGPLARLNVSESMTTPEANEAYKEMYEFFGEKPIHNYLAYHWSRLIIMINSAEEMKELIDDPDIAKPDVRGKLHEPSEGVGAVEAPRGTLYHHYVTDEDGIIVKANLIVPTTSNNAAICMAVKKAAQKLIKNGNVDRGLLNMVEMAYRAYDPCLACATHCQPGKMPIEIRIYNSEGQMVERLARNLQP